MFTDEEQEFKERWSVRDPGLSVLGTRPTLDTVTLYHTLLSARRSMPLDPTRARARVSFLTTTGESYADGNKT